MAKMLLDIRWSVTLDKSMNGENVIRYRDGVLHWTKV